MDSSRYVDISQFTVPYKAIAVKITPEQAARQMKKWIGKHGRQWPRGVTLKQIVSKLQLVYYPCWLVEGPASATWTAQVEDSFTKQVPGKVKCGYCDGTGQRPVALRMDITDTLCNWCNGTGVVDGMVEEKEYFWRSESGEVKGKISILRGGYDPSLGSLMIDLPDVDTTTLTPPQNDLPACRTASNDPKDLDKTRSLGTQAGLRRLFMTQHAQQVKNKTIRDIDIVNVQSDDVTMRPILLPVYDAALEYAGESLSFHVDASTGSSQSTVPASTLRIRERDRWLTKVVLGAMAVLMLILIVHLFGVESQIPECPTGIYSCLFNGVFGDDFLYVLVGAGLVGWGLRRFLGADTLLEQLRNGAIVAVPVLIWMVLTPFTGYDAYLTWFQRLVLAGSAFAFGATRGGVFSIFLGVFGLLHGGFFHFTDAVALPVMTICCVGAVFFDYGRMPEIPKVQAQALEKAKPLKGKGSPVPGQ